MKTVRRPGLTSQAATFLLCAAALLTLSAQTPPAQTTVVDETTLMSDSAIAHIDERNKRLFDATGLIVVVVVMRGASGQTALTDGIPAADKIAKGSYGALVWVATGGEQSDILFTGKALKWISYDQQVALRRELSNTMRYCCPGDSVARIVDYIAGFMETGAKITPNARNYVRDDLRMLNDQQTANIVAREERLEAATGKGVAVVLVPEQGGKEPGVIAYAMAQSFNVNGQIAALVWVTKGEQTSHFAMIQTPDFNTIPDATVQSIGSSFQADMQTGQFGEAIVAAVDRTATVLEGTSTPMPLPSPLESAPALGSDISPAPSESSAPAPRPSSNGTGAVIFLVLAIIAVFVIIALRRRNQ